MRKKGQRWNYELLYKTALKYKTRKEFFIGSVNAYNACQKRGILNSVCAHMEGTPYVKWTDSMLFDEAKKYKTRDEFKRGCVSAYQLSYQRGILDNVCKHMEDPPHRDKPHCVYLIEIFTTNNELFYYVGQTSNLENRLYMHFHFKGSNSTVYNFLNKTPINYKKHDIIKDNLTFAESIELESETIKDLKDRGINLLNKELI